MEIRVLDVLDEYKTAIINGEEKSLADNTGMNQVRLHRYNKFKEIVITEQLDKKSTIIFKK